MRSPDPQPECWLGYPITQLEEYLGPQRAEKLWEWMYGQTMSICDGQRYDHELQSYVDTCPEPHGPVIYVWDFQRWQDR